MWKYSKLQDIQHNISDEIINHSGVFSVQCKRSNKLLNDDIIMMTIEKGEPYIGVCESNYSPDTFTHDTPFEDTLKDVTYLYLGPERKRAFVHNSICADSICADSICAPCPNIIHKMFWHEKSPIYPYNIYIRIYKQKPQFRYDETEWTDFGNYCLKTGDYNPYIWVTNHDIISKFIIIKEKITPEAKEY